MLSFAYKALASQKIYFAVGLSLVLILGLLGPHRAHSKLIQIKRVELYEEKLKKAPGNIRIREKLAELYKKTKNYDKAIEVLAPYSSEASASALILLSEVYRLNNDSLNEVRTLQFLINKDPNRFRPHFLLGQAYERSKKTKEALEHYRYSVKLAKKHIPSYNAMLNIYREQKNFYEARLLVQDKIRNVGKRKEFYNELCSLYSEDGYLKEGVTVCQEAIKLDRKHPENHIFLARSYANQQKQEVAQRVFTNAAKRFKKSEFVLWATGEYFYQQKNYPEAVRYLQDAVKADKTSARAQLGLALSLFEISSYDKALNTYVNSCKYDKSKTSLMELRTAIARLRQDKKWRWADKFTKKEYLCTR